LKGAIDGGAIEGGRAGAGRGATASTSGSADARERAVRPCVRKSPIPEVATTAAMVAAIQGPALPCRLGAAGGISATVVRAGRRAGLPAVARPLFRPPRNAFASATSSATSRRCNETLKQSARRFASASRGSAPSGTNPASAAASSSAVW
jgi:hypothetical protein